MVSSSLKGEVYEMILTLLLSDESLSSGDIFSESRLTKKLHEMDKGNSTPDLFSRTTLREALMRLVGEGLIEQIPQKGLRVRKVIGDDEIAKFLEYRFLIEGFVTAKLAQQQPHEEQDMYVLKNILREMGWAAQKGDRAKFLQLDTEFHSKIAELAGYKRAAEDLRYLRIQTMIISLKAFEYDKEQVTDGVIGEHTAILDAIQNGNTEKAREAVKEHLRKVWNHLKSDEATPDFESVQTYISGDALPLKVSGHAPAQPKTAHTVKRGMVKAQGR